MNISKVLTYFFSVFCSIVILGCSSSPRFIDKEASHSKPQKPTVNSGIKNQNTQKVLLSLEGIASFYSEDFHGKLTSNGEIYDMNALTAAHRTFPFGTKVRVINLENNKSVVVRINDRGPFHESRIIDLSYGAAKTLDIVQSGTASVRLEVLEWGTGE